MKLGWTGFESEGKSQLMVVYAEKVFFRNVKWLKQREKLGLPRIPRTMAFDTPISPTFIKAIEDAGMKYIHFEDLRDLFPMVEVDIFMHEVYRWFPARGSESLTDDQRTFLSQGAKEGVDIYFCTQDFSLVHKGFRFLVNGMMYVVKVAGSMRPVRSAPPVKRIWGIVFYWDLDPKSFKGDSVNMETIGLPGFFLIRKEDTNIFDTNAKVIPSDLPAKKKRRQRVLYMDGDTIVEEKLIWV